MQNGSGHSDLQHHIPKLWDLWPSVPLNSQNCELDPVPPSFSAMACSPASAMGQFIADFDQTFPSMSGLFWYENN